MAFETIVYEHSEGIAKLTLARPHRLNSFTVRMHEEVVEVLDDVERDDGVRVLLLTGTGRGFCAGQDLGERAGSTGGAPADLGHSIERYYGPLVRRLGDLPKPVICAVNGVAAGAGANIALACDIVIAARSARFIQSFANIGLIPDTGGTWILPRLVGQARALGLALTGEPLSAERAEAWGMIWKCVDDEALSDEAYALAARFANGPTRGLAATKMLLRSSSLRSFDEALELERAAISELGFSEDYREGVAAFIEKRPARFTGR